MTTLRSMKANFLRSLILAGIILVSLASCAKHGQPCDAYRGSGSAKVKHHHR